MSYIEYVDIFEEGEVLKRKPTNRRLSKSRARKQQEIGKKRKKNGS